MYVVQETNLVLWRKKAEFRAGAAFMPWAVAIARFQVLAHVRDQSRERCLLDSELVAALSEETEKQVDKLDSMRVALRQCLDSANSWTKTRDDPASLLSLHVDCRNRTSCGKPIYCCQSCLAPIASLACGMYAPQNAGELKLESPEIDEFEQLVFDWEDGQLDDVGINRLRQLLRQSSDLRQRYVQRQVFAALVQMDRDAGLTTSSDEKVGCDSVLPVALANDSILEQEKPDLRPGKSPTLVRQDSRGLGQRLKRHQGILLVAAASIMLCFVLGRWLVVESRLKQAGSNQSAEANERSGKQEATSAGVALVTRLVDVTWHESAKNFMVGDAVPAGMVSLDSGVAQIEFFCGATVILEGPAQLWLESSSMARLQSGRVRAQVPPAARGFQIQVDELKVVDLGTEFGIAVNQGQAEVHVFDGEVELHQTNGEQRSLMAGTAVKRAEDGALKVADLNSNDFLGLERLNERVRSQKQSRYESWLAHSGELRKDPRVIVYYSMESDRAWTRKLTSSAVPVNRDLDAAVVGAKRVVGRWPQKSAIEFKGIVIAFVWIFPGSTDR